ncbi:unnamed protein product [Arctia plantaginis]|uniref:Uncharacterized protein n=1 Tax=Arctia plantaginis TaxID=874455 RepID=A0A8S1BBZ8_ARCPL|nr:unnamed protein product [Arctia plantaginis]CAB3255304.1 unnamed protein product [Arctia plantaginis]
MFSHRTPPTESTRIAGESGGSKLVSTLVTSNTITKPPTQKPSDPVPSRGTNSPSEKGSQSSPPPHPQTKTKLELARAYVIIVKRNISLSRNLKSEIKAEVLEAID